MKSPTVWRLIGTSLIVGLRLAKHSAILLLPTVGLLAIVEVVWRRKLSPDEEPVPAGRHVLRLALALAAIGAISITICGPPTASVTPSRRRAVQSSHGGATQPHTKRL